MKIFHELAKNSLLTKILPLEKYLLYGSLLVVLAHKKVGGGTRAPPPLVLTPMCS